MGSILLTIDTASQDEVALSYHSVRGLSSLAVIFAATINALYLHLLVSCIMYASYAASMRTVQLVHVPVRAASMRTVQLVHVPVRAASMRTVQLEHVPVRAASMRTVQLEHVPVRAASMRTVQQVHVPVRVAHYFKVIHSILTVPNPACPWKSCFLRVVPVSTNPCLL